MTGEVTHLAGLAAIAIDCTDPPALASWWLRLLGSTAEMAVADDGDARIWLPGTPPIDFLQVPDPAAAKTPIHLDLMTTDFDAAVARALHLGAVPADDLYDGDDWQVFRDPEGHEFCLLRPGGNDWVSRPEPVADRPGARRRRTGRTPWNEAAAPPPDGEFRMDPIETFGTSGYTSPMTTVMHTHEAFTIDDLDTFPDDGNRYELIEGSLHVTPAPVVMHQRITMNLSRILRESNPPELEVFFAPFDVVLGPATVVEPDLLVTEVGSPGEKRLEVPPLLVVEVLSPSTRLYDLGTKRLVYREAGVGAYWVVDPAVPSLTAWRWDGEHEAEHVIEGEATGTLEWPYPVTVTPARLLLPNG